MKKILVIEDNQQHLADAKRTYANAWGVVFEYATTLYEAGTVLMSSTFDGIICDIFFPVGGEGVWKDALIKVLIDRCRAATESRLEPELERLKQAPDHMTTAIELWVGKLQEALIEISSWSEPGARPPCGLSIFEYAVSNDIPLVFHTDSDAGETVTQIVAFDCTESRHENGLLYRTNSKWIPGYESADYGSFGYQRYVGNFQIPGRYHKTPPTNEKSRRDARYHVVHALKEVSPDHNVWKEALSCILRLDKGLEGRFVPYEKLRM